MNKTILITGCTKGIGLAIAELFAANGFNVAGCSRSKDDLTALFRKLSTAYPKQQFFLEACNVSKKESLQTFAADVIREFQQIDVLVNNAGVFIPGQIHNEEEGTLETLLASNLNSAYNLTRAILPGMMKRKKGHIFNICSTASITAYLNGGSYCISKFALLGMSKVLRQEMKEYQVRVTSIIPGATLTDSWSGTSLPPERFMQSSDVAKAVWTAWEVSGTATIEEIVMRPLEGDIS